eukprot:scaffold71334_cov28-Tisochrysis_lutea.AAC.3
MELEAWTPPRRPPSASPVQIICGEKPWKCAFDVDLWQAHPPTTRCSDCAPRSGPSSRSTPESAQRRSRYHEDVLCRDQVRQAFPPPLANMERDQCVPTPLIRVPAATAHPILAPRPHCRTDEFPPRHPKSPPQWRLLRANPLH